LSSVCEDMGKITVTNLAATLSNLDNAPPVTVNKEIREPARVALERMLAVCS